MRRSLADFPGMARDIPYPGTLAPDLIPYHAYVMDSGHCLCAVPLPLLPSAKGTGQLWRYEVPLPVRFVLERGYTWTEAAGERFLVVDVPYSSDMGVEVPDGYDEFDEPANIAPQPQELYRGMTLAWAIGAAEGMRLIFSDSQAYLICLYRRPNQNEISQFSKGNFQIGTFIEDGVLFVLIKPGALQWQDHPYLPQEDEAAIFASLINKANASLPIAVALVDTSNGAIVSEVRRLTLPDKLVKALAELCPHLLRHRTSAEQYIRNFSALQSIYSSSDMAESGITYQLTEG